MWSLAWTRQSQARGLAACTVSVSVSDGVGYPLRLVVTYGHFVE
jgi:hypothetical protein